MQMVIDNRCHLVKLRKVVGLDFSKNYVILVIESAKISVQSSITTE